MTFQNIAASLISASGRSSIDGCGAALPKGAVHYGRRQHAARDPMECLVCFVLSFLARLLHCVSSGLSKQNLLRVKVLQKFGCHKDDKKPEGRMLIKDQYTAA